MPKRDKFGILLKIESICLDLLNTAIEATLKQKGEKEPLLQNIRIKVENLKRLIRICRELKIIEDRQYIHIEQSLQEISKMALGWLKYLTQKEPLGSFR